MEFPNLTVLIAIGLILYAIFKTWKLIQQYLKKSSSQSWQVTTAEVLTKQVVKKFSTRSGASYYPEIAYRYSVMGQNYENTTRLQKNHTHRSAEEKVDKIGISIGVRYNPNQPKEHVSEYDIVNYADILQIVISLVLAGIMLYPYLR
jgi:hypothetical protein